MTQNKSKTVINDNLSEYVRMFFDWMIVERGTGFNTIHAYRDTLKLFLIFLVNDTSRNVENLQIQSDVYMKVLDFLGYLESKRKVSITTRNHRLSVLKSFFRFVALKEPLLAAFCRRVILIPLKKHNTELLDYLEPDEMEAIITSVNRCTKSGRRDFAILLLLYNTGCRSSELAMLTREDVFFEKPAYVKILGKGQKRRFVPLWSRTVDAIKNVIKDRCDNHSTLFLNQRKDALTRAGVSYIVKKYVSKAILQKTSLTHKNITPHTIRHSTAVALLRATGDIDATAKILGHASLNSTKIYTDKDKTSLTNKLNQISLSLLGENNSKWNPSDDLLNWLESL